MQFSHFTGKNNRSSRYDELESENESLDESDVNNGMQSSGIKSKLTLNRPMPINFEPLNLQ